MSRLQRTQQFRETVEKQWTQKYWTFIQENPEKDIKNQLTGLLNRHFRPEFINRIDEIVIFNNLEKSQIKSIAKLQIEQLQSRLSEIGLSIKVNDDIINQIVENGYDPVYGARPIKRTILKMLENPLSQKILSGEFESGDTVLVNSKNDKVNFSSQKK